MVAMLSIEFHFLNCSKCKLPAVTSTHQRCVYLVFVCVMSLMHVGRLALGASTAAAQCSCV